MSVNEAHRAVTQQAFQRLEVAESNLARSRTELKAEQTRVARSPIKYILAAARVNKGLKGELTNDLTDLPMLEADISNRENILAEKNSDFLKELAKIPEGLFRLISVTYHPQDMSHAYLDVEKHWLVGYQVSIDSSGRYHDLEAEETSAQTFTVTRGIGVLYARLAGPSQQVPTIQFRQNMYLGIEHPTGERLLERSTAPLLTLPEGFPIYTCAEPNCYPFNFDLHRTAQTTPFTTFRPKKLVPPLPLSGPRR